MTGWTEAAALDQPLEAVLRIQRGHSGALIENLVAEVLRRGQVVTLEDHAILVSRQGASIPIEGSAAPIHDEQGAVPGAVVTVRDVTEKRRSINALKESEQRFRQMADFAPIMIWVADADKKCIWFNRPWLNFTGRPMDEELGFGWADGVHKDDLPRCLKTYIDAFDARRPFRMEYRLRRHDGMYRWVLDHGLPVNGPDGSFAGYLGSALDIHEYRQTEDALRNADRRKNEFLAMLAHELRNPLATIHYATRLARMPEISQQEVDWIEMIDRQVKHLARLVDDLLDVSRITRGKIELKRQRIDAARPIRQAAEMVRPMIEERRHELSLQLPDQPLPLDADATRIEQVFQNLLMNAAKYTEAGGRIEIRGEVDQGQLVVHVTDTGIGMSPDWVPYVFDLFTQGERALDRSQGGLGIGLTLVKQIVEMHGGTVHADSKGLGQGSTFTVRLPLAPDVALPDTPACSFTTAGADRPLKVLVVEDNEEAAHAVRVLLQSAGHEVAVCTHGLHALAAARNFQPNVVLLDIGLPGKDGYQIAQEMRADERLRNVQIVAVSGYGQSRGKESCREAGFDDHLVKPIDFDALLSVLRAESPACR